MKDVSFRGEPEMNARIPVYLHAEDPISRAGLETALRFQREIDLVDVEAPESPRVAILAVDTLDEKAMRVMRGLNARGCTRSVVVANTLSDTDLLAAVEAGACAIVWRSEATASHLVHAVVKAASGDAMLPSDVLSRLLRQVSRLQRHVLSPMGLNLGGLSSREADVLRLAADGLDTGEIALKLSYSKRTVTNILHDVTNRFHLTNRTHAVAYAIREGLI
jgi:DNA-binding NarL/FixJ family response regulator